MKIINNDIPEWWIETTLWEVSYKIAMGPFWSNIKVETFVFDWIPIISWTHLKWINLEDKNYNFISKEHAEKLKNSKVYRWDIIFTHAWNIWQVSCIPENSKYEEYIISQRQFYLRCNKDKLDSKYITYYFKSRNWQYKLLANSSQVWVPSIAQPSSYLKQLSIILPTLPEQQAIAKILSSFDDKIELLREQNIVLEQTAQTIFHERFGKYWLNDELPDWWRVGKLGEEFDILMWQSPDGESYNNSGKWIVFFQWRAEFQERFPKIRLFTTEPKRLADKFDILVSVRAPVGDINVAHEQCCIGRWLAAVKSKQKSYCLYKIKSLKESFDKFESEGTVFWSINKDSFLNIEVIIPNLNEIERIENIINPFDKQILNNFNHIQALSKTRDELLPRLMSWEVRVNFR